MKVWLCRDNFGGNYSIFREGCEITFDDDYRIWCGDMEHFIACVTRYAIKDYYGLKRHIKKGTKKLVNWKFPLKGVK